MLDDIGVGRFGPVYRAQAPGADGGTVAVKVFDQGLSPEQAAVLAHSLNRLCQAPLDHPSIVRLLEAGAIADLAWLAETYVSGTPLDIVIGRDGPQPLADVLLRLTQIAGALDFAAAVGVFHGALHPRDILLADDRTQLTGLGVVQALSEAGLDVPMQGAGVSPQRALGLPVSHADDIFTLAAITFEVLYGTPLHDPADLPALATPLPGIDHKRLRDVLMGSLADDPADRPGTALEFAGALQQVIAEQPMAMPMRDFDSGIPIRDSDSEIPIPIPVPGPAPEVDLPLRVDQPLAERRIEFDLLPDLRSAPEPEPDLAKQTPQSELPNRNRESEAHYEVEPARGSVWLAITAGLAIGLIGGFVSGFVVGQRDATPVPRAAERPIPRAQREAAPVPVAPAPTTGQDFTESTVPPTVVEEPEVKPTERADRPEPPASDQSGRTEQPERSERAEQSERSEPALTGPASIDVVSRPAGAQVFVDGRLVGTTPLVLADVRPGTYAVRIALPGHKRWATTLELAAGSRARVAASLER